MEKYLDIITLWAPVVLVILSVVNSATLHYTKFNGVLRVIMAVVERLSFLASKNAPQRLKAPGVNVPPDPITERLMDVQEQFKKLQQMREGKRRR